MNTQQKFHQSKSHAHLALIGIVYKIYDTIPTGLSDLREISTASVAIALWNHVDIPKAVYRTHSIVTHRDSSWCQLTIIVRTSVVKLPVPKSIRECINEYVHKIRTEIENWVTYHHRVIFFQNGKDNHLYSHVPYFVWNPDGSINYKMTARSVLPSLRLSHVEKYRFMCTYCLKTELEEWIRCFYYEKVLDYVAFQDYPLIYYWNCCFRNRLNVKAKNENGSLDCFMFQLSKVDNWSAKEFFFDRLNSEEKVQSAISLIDHYDATYQKMILQKLSKSERLKVYLVRSVEIIKNYSKLRNSASDILSTWHDVCHLFDEKQFIEMYSNLICSPNAYSILSSIWVTVSYEFKRCVLECDNYKIVLQIFAIHMIDTNQNEFLFAVLSDMDSSIKEEIIKRPFFRIYCDKLFASQNLQVFNRLLKVCLPNEKELSEFRRDLVISSTHVENQCLTYYSSANVTQMNSFLNKLLPSHPDTIVQYKTNLVLSEAGIRSCSVLFNTTGHTLNSIVADSLPSKYLAASFKKNIAFSKFALTRFCEWIVSDKLSFSKDSLNIYLESEHDKRTLKKRILNNLNAYDIVKIFSSYDQLYWDQILQWGFEDNESIEEFKGNLPMDNIFNRFLKNAIFSTYNYHNRLSSCTLRKVCEFESVDRFLNWYFVSPAEIKEFKLQTIYSYRKLDAINTLLKKKNNQLLKNVMKWFLGDDELEKYKFREMNTGKICAAL